MEILDSGNRTEFASGAVRDIQEGKGRFTVMPLDVVAKYMVDDAIPRNPFIGYIDDFLRNREVKYLYCAIETFSHENIKKWSSAAEMFLDVAIHFEQGAKKYGEDNWRKGLPIDCYINSAMRHYLKWLAGWDDEPHDRAVIWNLLCCIWTFEHNDKIRAEVQA